MTSAALALAAMLSSAAMGAPGSLSDAVQAALERPSIQQNLPRFEDKPATEEPGSAYTPDRPAEDAGDGVEDDGYDAPYDEPSGGSDWSGFLQILFWIAAGAALLILIALLADAVSIRHGRPARVRVDDTEDEPVVAEPTRRAPVLPPGLEEADRLAQAGDIAEAVRTLLRAAIAGISGRMQAGVPRSLTGREIARSTTLPDNARPPIGAMVSVVERGHFGGKDVTAEDYRQCRDSFLAVVQEGADRPPGS